MSEHLCCGAPMWMHEVLGVYDGGLYYECPTCHSRAHRWPEGDWRHASPERVWAARDAVQGEVTT